VLEMLIRGSVVGDCVDSDVREPDRVREGSQLWDQWETVDRLDVLSSSGDRGDEGCDESVMGGGMALSPPFLVEDLECF
jgi:hypothetical protein